MSPAALLITLLIVILVIAGAVIRVAMSLPLGQFTASGDTFENL